MLLGGKLVSCLVRSREVRDDFARKYGKSCGVISRQIKGAQLVVVTTSSSLGRSSVYNRLKLDNEAYMRSIGFTQGWGHFHVPDTLFAELRAYLRKRKHKYVDGHRFGEGPNWRLRTICAAFDALGFKADLLRHGIGREVFICEVARNAREILRGDAIKANYHGLKTVSEIGESARARWIILRAERRSRTPCARRPFLGKHMARRSRLDGRFPRCYRTESAESSIRRKGMAFCETVPHADERGP